MIVLQSDTFAVSILLFLKVMLLIRGGGVTMAVYGALADSKSTTKPLVVEMVKQPRFCANRSSRSWCIPALVKLVGGSIS